MVNKNTIQKKLNELNLLFGKGSEDFEELRKKVVVLVSNKTWRPEIVDAEQRKIAAAIQIMVSGKGSKKVCIAKFLKTGVVSNFQGCRDRMVEAGFLINPKTEEDIPITFLKYKVFCGKDLVEEFLDKDKATAEACDLSDEGYAEVKVVEYSNRGKDTIVFYP